MSSSIKAVWTKEIAEEVVQLSNLAWEQNEAVVIPRNYFYFFGLIQISEYHFRYVRTSLLSEMIDELYNETL